MLIPSAAAIGLVVGIGLWKLAELDNAREAAEEINAVGGLGSPWAQVEIPRNVTASKQFWDDLDSRFTPEEIAKCEANPMLGVLEDVAANLGISAPSPAVSSPVSSRLHMMPESQVQPAIEAVATTPQTTGCSDGAVEWLQSNAAAFPVPMPPPLVECYADRQALIKATAWVAKAIDAGVSQNKVVTVVFGSAKGTANYSRIVELYKEIKGDE